MAGGQVQLGEEEGRGSPRGLLLEKAGVRETWYG